MNGKIKTLFKKKETNQGVKTISCSTILGFVEKLWKKKGIQMETKSADEKTVAQDQVEDLAVCLKI